MICCVWRVFVDYGARACGRSRFFWGFRAESVLTRLCERRSASSDAELWHARALLEMAIDDEEASVEYGLSVASASHRLLHRAHISRRRTQSYASPAIDSLRGPRSYDASCAQQLG